MRQTTLDDAWSSYRLLETGAQVRPGGEDPLSCQRRHSELEFIDDVVDELGSREAVNHIHNVLRDGTGADRQLEVYRKTGDMNAVVDYLISATLGDLQ